MAMFFDENKERLSAFAVLSHKAGSRADYVQGGGGNTSVKLPGGLMAIKASGFCLSDIAVDKGYAVLDYTKIRDFYLNNQPENLGDPEAAGSQCTKDNTLTVEGLPALRPSVEAGFHSILKTYVLHTHSVYANLAACTVGGREVAARAFADAPYSWGWVDYRDPGAMLAFSIREEMARVEEKTGKTPSVILMQNHGIIVHDDDPQACTDIHADANARLAACYGLTGSEMPAVSIRQAEEGLFAADSPYLAAAFRSGVCSYETLMTKPLYPDQMVFLNGCLFQDRDTVEEGEAVANSKTGALLMRMGEKKAKTLVETLTAVFFVTETVNMAGFQVSNMSEAARSFIANWESEKYRRSLSDRR